MKRIERLAEIDPTDQELELGAELKGSIMSLATAMGTAGLTLDSLLSFRPTGPNRHVLVLPSERVSRNLVGYKYHQGSRTLVEGATSRPFIIESLFVYGMHPHNDAGIVPTVEGRSPTWESQDGRLAHILHYRYGFELAAHTLAIVGRDSSVEQ
jgi:hypothetical protein